MKLIPHHFLGIVCLSFFLVGPQFSLSQTHSNLINESQVRQLSKDPYWMALLHFGKNSDGSYQSSTMIDDPSFFLSPEGHQNPEKELIATILAPNFNRCQFPARYLWIQDQIEQGNLTLNKNPSQHGLSCTDYDNWRAQVDGHSATLIFPAAYLNSPSSMFGHTLLRIDPPNVSQGSDWLSWGINFGANANSNDNSVSYAFRGLTGAYPGQFSMVPYFKKIKEYSRFENRDIWEYQLNLTPEEVNRLLAHAWELKDINFDYYFIDENCSYRLLELLEVARPGLSLTEEFTGSAIPVNTVRAVKRARLIKGAKYRPSKASELAHFTQQLSPEEQALALNLANNPNTLTLQKLETYPFHQQRTILKTSYKYLRYLQDAQSRTPSSVKKSLTLLKRLNALPKPSGEIAQEDKMSVPPAPELGHETRLIGLSQGLIADSTYWQLQYRLTYHDLLDPHFGYLQGAQIELGKFKFRRYTKQSLKLQEAALIHILSVPPQDRFFKPWSWHVYFGAQRHEFDFINTQNVYSTLATQAVGGFGKSMSFGERGYGYILLTTAGEYNELFQDDWDIGSGIKLGIQHQSRFSQSALTYNAQLFTDDWLRQQWQLIYQFNLNTTHSVRFNYNYTTNTFGNDYQIGNGLKLNQIKKRADSLGIEYRHYF